jgi:hypothetical protein
MIRHQQVPRHHRNLVTIPAGDPGRLGAEAPEWLKQPFDLVG